MEWQNWHTSSVIEALMAGDDDLFQAIYQVYRDDFISWLVNCYEADEAVAIDCFQEALSNLYLNAYAGKLRENNCSIKGYIYAIGKYQLFKRQRKFQLENQPLRDQEACDEQELFFWELHLDPEQDDESASVKAYDCLKKLDQHCRTILELFYLNQHTYEQLSKKLGYTKEVLRTQKWRCLNKLRKLLEHGE